MIRAFYFLKRTYVRTYHTCILFSVRVRIELWMEDEHERQSVAMTLTYSVDCGSRT